MNPDEPQFEKYWRDRIATELEEYIRAWEMAREER